jgi:hypothetical protein
MIMRARGDAIDIRTSHALQLRDGETINVQTASCLTATAGVALRMHALRMHAFALAHILGRRIGGVSSTPEALA